MELLGLMPAKDNAHHSRGRKIPEVNPKLEQPRNPIIWSYTYGC